MRRQVLSLFVAVTSLALFAGADWRQFRGNRGDGIADGTVSPASLKKLAWKVPLTGRGLSTPIVVGDKVFVTSSSGYRQNRLHVTCFDVQSGKKLWERQFWATGRTQCHKRMCVATPTPASDGKRIFAFYSSNDLVCLDLDGNLLWLRGLTHDFPNASNSLGMSSSPVVIGDTLIVQVENDAHSFATGIDVKTGVSRWLKQRPQKANWTSPTILPAQKGGKALALLQSSAGLSAVDPKTGKEIWTYEDGASTIPSAVVSGDVIYLPSKGLTALRTVRTNSTPEILWQENALAPSVSSPLAYRGRIYIVTGGGVLKCADAKTGKLAWQLRVQGKYSSTPIAANGRLYLISDQGRALIVNVATGGGKGKIIARRDLKETILCTPALANGALYTRSDGHLWKFLP
ncbi:MAG: PQQ-binding-like beta-propeller repeat protein [Planctomycetes bacterium]|nr:PQQ-binding-like beta-propeller repeat protein [Planctomycetota bacterium]